MCGRSPHITHHKPILLRRTCTFYFGIFVSHSQWTHFLYVCEMCHTNSKFESTEIDVDQDLMPNLRPLQKTSYQ